MAEDLAFVPSLGTPEEYIPASEVPPGTHAYYILKESLRPVGAYENVPTRIPDSFILATSFPDILPPAGREAMSGAYGIFARGEFLFLRAFGNDECALPLVGEPKDNFWRIADSVAEAAPRIIYYRLTDFITDDFTFLHTPPEMIDLRGAGRLLADEALLEQELTLIQRWKTAGKAVRVIIPYIKSPDEQRAIQTRVGQAHPDQIGPMVDRVEQAQNITSYPPGDFVFPGPSDLTADVRQVSRVAYREGEDAERQTLAIVQTMAQQVAMEGLTDVLTANILVGKIHVYPDQGQVKHVYMPNQLIASKS